MENMKHIIVRNVKIQDSQSRHNDQKRDILIVDGIIKKIASNINISDPFFEAKLPDKFKPTKTEIAISNPYHLNEKGPNSNNSGPGDLSAKKICSIN